MRNCDWLTLAVSLQEEEINHTNRCFHLRDGEAGKIPAPGPAARKGPPFQPPHGNGILDLMRSRLTFPALRQS